MKNAFDGLFGRTDTAEGRFCELKNLSIKSSKPGKHREQRLKQQNKISKDWNNYKRNNISVIEIPEEKSETVK